MQASSAPSCVRNPCSYACHPAVNRSTNGSALSRERRKAVEDPAEHHLRNALVAARIQVHVSSTGLSLPEADPFSLC
ncbi:hypothetical protein IG631_17568 [Alternaria alternata]|nr:hypothetical protein IG631_17568 [Alternaria alternata]